MQWELYYIHWNIRISIIFLIVLKKTAYDCNIILLTTFLVNLTKELFTFILSHSNMIVVCSIPEDYINSFTYIYSSKNVYIYIMVEFW